MKKYKNDVGITLIALTITIVVLLILAGVTIAALSGDNGILQNAAKAKVETEEATNIEKIKLAINAAQMENNGNSEIEKADLEIALSENGTKSIVVDNKDGTRNIIFLDDKKIYKINNDGSIEDTNSDFSSIYIAPETQNEERNEGVIGIGTDGNPVDMDLWEYLLLEDGTYTLNDNNGDISNGRGYIGNINSDGTITGKIPQYISVDNGKTYNPVTSLKQCMIGKSELKIAPEIPSTVTNIRDMFYHLTNLEQMSNIPNSVTNMQGTFNGCVNLVTIPNFPSELESLSSTFSGCTKLEYVPDIPEKVVNMYQTFFQCSSLVEVSDIPEGVQNMELTFFQCKSLTSVKRIPSTVTTLKQTFQECIKLSGEMKIDANITDISSCHLTFFGATNQNGITLRLKGTCPVLSEIVSNTNNPNITL